MNETFTAATITVRKVAKTIDHSLLKPQLTVAEVLAGCDLAARTLDALIDCINAGIDRCGATTTAEMLDDLKARQA